MVVVLLRDLLQAYAADGTTLLLTPTGSDQSETPSTITLKSRPRSA
jgi:hypothetical protein